MPYLYVFFNVQIRYCPFLVSFPVLSVWWKRLLLRSKSTLWMRYHLRVSCCESRDMPMLASLSFTNVMPILRLERQEQLADETVSRFISGESGDSNGKVKHFAIAVQ